MIWLAWDLFGSLTQPLGATGSEGDEDDNSHADDEDDNSHGDEDGKWGSMESGLTG